MASAKETMVVRLNMPGRASGYLELRVRAASWQEAHEIAKREVSEHIRVDYCVDAGIHDGRGRTRK